MRQVLPAAWRGPWMVLASVCLAALVLPLSFSGGAVATPAIGRALGGSATSLGWITNAFMLGFGSCLMAAGALADQWGRKRLFLLGLSSFCLAGLGLVLARSVWQIDLLRALQGVAAAATLAGGTAALAQEFVAAQRAQAFSLLGTTFGTGLAFGPLLTGWLMERAGWQAGFALCTGLGLLALLVGIAAMRESRDPQAQGLDWPGALLFTCALALLTLTMVEAAARGWHSPLVIALLLASAAALLLFVAVERRVARPMLDLSLFRYPRFVGVQVLPIATCYCYVVLLVLLPLQLIGIGGYSEVAAGWWMLALSAPMLVVPLAAAWLTRWFGPGPISAAGLLLAAGGLLWLAQIPVEAGGMARVLPLLLIGSGAGLPWGLMDGLSVSMVPKERAGMATGIFSTVRVAGEGIALAMVTALLAGFITPHLPASLEVASLQTAAQQLAMGELRQALALLPAQHYAAAAPGLQKAYGQAFAQLLQVLAAIATVSALVVLALLRPARGDALPAAAATPQ
ncbi:MFS transporter [Comamonas sp.]|uniref:MFS transporter n=1 Tax=Comamonas sp. TaxID=34028 RepID=UPI00289D6752|nr:MFS transporter [Comamonas sp.]